MTQPARGRTPRRTVAGALAGLVALAAFALPIAWTGLAVYASLTGCFIECSAPEHDDGFVYAGLAALLLFAPFAIGMTVAGVRSRAAWWSTAALCAVVVGGWVSLALAHG